MGLFNIFSKKTVESTHAPIEEKIVFNDVQVPNFRGFHKFYTTTYNGDDTTNFDNAKKLFDKYGKELIGSHIIVKKVKYNTNEYMFKIYIDDMIVGVVFKTSENYALLENNRIEKMYGRIDDSDSNMVKVQFLVREKE